MSTRIVILAAGKGKRMVSELPKVLIPLRGKPILIRLLESVRASGVDPQPVVVVGRDNGEAIKAAAGPDYEYVVQEEQLGTGHAVQAAEPLLKGQAGAVMVLYGDHPLLSAATIRALDEAHRRSGAVLTMMTTSVESFDDWQAVFKDFGRVIRDAGGKIARIVERKDASPEELQIREVNPSFFCFDVGWLWENLGKLKNNNNQHEFYLTDLVKMAMDEGHPIDSIQVGAGESIGVNTPEQLDIVKRLI